MASKKASKARAKKAPSKARATKTPSRVPIKKKAAAKKAAPAEPVTATALTRLRSEVDDLFDRYFPGFPRFPRRLMDLDPFTALEMPSSLLPRWGTAPSVDLSETNEGYEVSADLPGLDDKDIEVSVTDTTLTIRGEKQEEREEEKKDYHMRERRYGSFQRTLRIPDDVDGSKISATFSKGLLKISLPKSVKAKSAKRRLKVEAG